MRKLIVVLAVIAGLVGPLTPSSQAAGVYSLQQAVALWPMHPSGNPAYPLEYAEVVANRYSENGQFVAGGSWSAAQVCLTTAAQGYSGCYHDGRYFFHFMATAAFDFDLINGTARLHDQIDACPADVSWAAPASPHAPNAGGGVGIILVDLGVRQAVVVVGTSPRLIHSWVDRVSTGTACGWDSLMNGPAASTNLYESNAIQVV